MVFCYSNLNGLWQSVPPFLMGETEVQRVEETCSWLHRLRQSWALKPGLSGLAYVFCPAGLSKEVVAFPFLETHQQNENINPFSQEGYTWYSLLGGLFLLHSLTLPPGVLCHVTRAQISHPVFLPGAQVSCWKTFSSSRGHILFVSWSLHVLITLTEHHVPSLLQRFTLQNVTFPLECKLLLETLACQAI